MRAIEFKSKINNNQILIPAKIQSALKSNKNNEVRVIVLFDDLEKCEYVIFRQTAQNSFLKGYSESDSIYDNY